MLRLTFAIALTLSAAPCAANDTSASIDAGGLVFEKSTGIEMKSEVLYISPGKIEVDYVFVNRTAEEIKTVVAFPLPDLDLQKTCERNVSIPFEQQENFVGFRTWVDGQEVQLSSDVHAILEDGRDIAKDLQRLNVNRLLGYP